MKEKRKKKKNRGEGLVNWFVVVVVGGNEMVQTDSRSTLSRAN
jgi:hypothetical protein